MTGNPATAVFFEPEFILMVTVSIIQKLVYIYRNINNDNQMTMKKLSAAIAALLAGLTLSAQELDPATLANGINSVMESQAC